jgi:hypothetical protein
MLALLTSPYKAQKSLNLICFFHTTKLVSILGDILTTASTLCEKLSLNHGYRVWWENLRKRENLEVPGVDGRIILN